MRRRQFIKLLGGAAAAWPLAAGAQQQTVPTIGILVRAVPGSEEFRHLFPEALRDLGYVDGKNVRLEFRSDEGQINRLPQLAAELVRLKVDVIVPWFTPAAAAAKQATREIPIVCAACGDPVVSIRAAIKASSTTPVVFITGSDPVQGGLVPSLGRPAAISRASA